jgi:hypothetical protein
MSIAIPSQPDPAPAAAPRPAPGVRAWTVTELAERFVCKPHAILALIRAGELRAVNIAAPGANRPHWRILPNDLAAFEARRAAVPAQQPAPRKKQKQDQVPVLDAATGKVNRAFGVVGSAAMEGLR